MSLAYGWTPDEIGNLTLAQIVIYSTDSPDINELRPMNREMAMAHTEHVAETKERWIQRQIDRVRLHNGWVPPC